MVLSKQSSFPEAYLPKATEYLTDLTGDVKKQISSSMLACLLRMAALQSFLRLERSDEMTAQTFHFLF